MYVICAYKSKIETDLVTLFWSRDKSNRENHILPRNINIGFDINLFRIFDCNVALRSILLTLVLIKEDVAVFQTLYDLEQTRKVGKAERSGVSL